MPPKHRLTRADFKLFPSQKSRRTRGVYVTLSITPLPVGTPPKVACIVSKKAAKKAVDRNRIKRRVRAILQPLMSQIKGSVALAFYANNATNKATSGDVSNDIMRLLQGGGYLE